MKREPSKLDGENDDRMQSINQDDEVDDDKTVGELDQDQQEAQNLLIKDDNMHVLVHDEEDDDPITPLIQQRQLQEGVNDPSGLQNN